MDKLICGGDPREIGIEDEYGNWDILRLRDHIRYCTICEIAVTCLVTQLKGYLTQQPGNLRSPTVRRKKTTTTRHTKKTLTDMVTEMTPYELKMSLIGIINGCTPEYAIDFAYIPKMHRKE